MEKDIDEILAHYLNKQSLTEEEKQFLQEWIQTSSTLEEFWATFAATNLKSVNYDR